MYACEEGHDNIVRILLNREYGVKVNDQTSGKCTLIINSNL